MAFINTFCLITKKLGCFISACHDKIKIELQRYLEQLFINFRLCREEITDASWIRI